MSTNGHTDKSRPLPWNRTAELQKRYTDANDRYKHHVVNRFKGADLDRFSRDMRGTYYLGSSGDRHYKEEIRFYRLIEIARDIDRNDMTASQGLDRLSVNVLQNGFKYDPETGNDQADAYCKEKWHEWSTECSEVDLQEERDFDELSWSIFRAMMLDGDQLVNPLASGQFQTIEGHLLRTPWGRLSGDDLRLTIHGVKLDWKRRRESYWIAEDDIPMWETLKYQTQNYQNIRAFDADGNPNIFHIKHNHKRMGSQTRGVTVFAPIVHAVGMLDDIQFAKLVQQQSVSSWVAQIKREIEGEYPDEENVVSQQEMADLCKPGEWKEIDDLAAGMLYKGLPGETLNGFSPNVPNPTFFDHAKQITEVIGTNIYLPYIVLMMDATETNFSGWRGAVDQAKMLWMWLQKTFARQWHRPAFQFKMRQWTTPGSEHYDPFLAGMLNRGIDVYRHSWKFPNWPYVNPVEDVTANALEVQKAQNSPRRVQARQGRDYQEVIVGEMLDDNFALIDRAMQLTEDLNTRYPDQSVTWERLVSVAPPDNINFNTSKTIEDDNADETMGNPPVEQPIG